MRLTKLDMARVIVQQLYRMPGLPSVDHWHVRILLKGTLAILRPAYDMAIDAANSQIRKECKEG